ncbi:hypothetical protein HNR02_004666 [Amycolatopsis endophytica]|uniref:Uncharacterized protein n=1 Tax=Amycolatopsis endophytica TaxID=860233 RepID=A0A853B7R5_9PSEU|nr:hypothetical protein [Amycolatopsis endophytica]
MDPELALVGEFDETAQGERSGSTPIPLNRIPAASTFAIRSVSSSATAVTR